MATINLLFYGVFYLRYIFDPKIKTFIWFLTYSISQEDAIQMSAVESSNGSRIKEA